MRPIFFLVAVVALFNGRVSADAPSAYGVEDFIKKDIFDHIKLSPTGEYYAATLRAEDRTVLAIVRRSDKKKTATFVRGRNSHIENFWWVNNERVLISTSEKIGILAEPRLTGELYGINADGSKNDIMVGQGVREAPLDGRAKLKKVEKIAAFLVDDLEHDERNVIITTMPFTDDPKTRAEKLDVYTGQRTVIARAPIRNAKFYTDNNGSVRFVMGRGVDNVGRTYYRASDAAEWELINDESITDVAEWPIGFSEDNATAYLRTGRAQGPDVLIAMDVATRKRREILSDDDTDPEGSIFRGNTGIPVGAYFMDGRPRTMFFDNGSMEARLYRGLEAAFPGETVAITSYTSDGKLALLRVGGDRNPGTFYIFDIAARKAHFLVSSRSWLVRDHMAEMRPISLKSRDGLTLRGYLTVPPASQGKNLPMIVMPHGGPYNVYDRWEFDDDTQLLAASGYAVLQINFRGSGNQGRSFAHAGALQWGRKMQDDVTDATRWAIEQGVADASRVCIYGASYGAYAALMGAIREPSLYRCAAGYVGVYDLPLMHRKGDIQRSDSGETYLNEWIGKAEDLAAVSPTRLATQIKVPVFLAAGGEDERAPLVHSKQMEQALLDAGVPVETLYVKREGHGFYLEANRREYYTRLLAFLGKHLQTAVPSN
jgi:dipeptidyl aminopeptidase/acylaminoacyl peptidase